MRPRKPLPDAELLRYLFHYKPLTGELVRKVRTGPRTQVGDIAGTVANTGAIHVRVENGTYQAHRLVWKWVYGTDPQELDHINLVRTDNRIWNLREATPSQNAMNRPPMGRYAKGVTKIDNGFVSTISKDGRKHYLGYYKSEAEAAEAYAEAAAKLHGSFARVG